MAGAGVKDALAGGLPAGAGEERRAQAVEAGAGDGRDDERVLPALRSAAAERRRPC
jgi:hypothetical protein